MTANDPKKLGAALLVILEEARQSLGWAKGTRKMYAPGGKYHKLSPSPLSQRQIDSIPRLEAAIHEVESAFFEGAQVNVKTSPVTIQRKEISP